MKSTEGSALVICFTLGLSTAVGVGLARFAYALILPSMQAGFGWSYAEAGALNAVNSAGYLAGALAAAGLIARFGSVNTLVAGAALTAVSVMGTGLVEAYAALLTLRITSGVAGALAFVAGGVLVARVASDLGSRGSAGIGLFYTGPGVGVVVAGLVVPPLLGADDTGWRGAWVALGASAVVFTVLVTLAARRADRFAEPKRAVVMPSGVSLIPALVAYACFAGGYIGYLTFAIAAVREAGAGAMSASLWWLALGAASIGSFRIWARQLAAANGASLALVLMLSAVATALPLIAPSPWVFLASFVLFGGTFLVVVALTTNMVRLARPYERWPAWIGYFTIVFGCGQTVGPVLGGMVADSIGSSDGVLWVSSVLLGGGGLAALLQPATARR